MNSKERARAEARRRLVDVIERMGHPREFGILIADSLGTEKTMRRMTGYILKARPETAEEIADEMLAIQSDRSRWVEKKTNEYYSGKYYKLRRFEGFGGEDE